MSLLTHTDAVRGLTDAFGRVTAAAQVAAERVTVLVGGSNADRAFAVMLANFFTRLEGGQVGTMNPTEAEIQRRQVTRVGPEAGLVGRMNPTEAEIERRQFTRTGAEAGLVGRFDPIYSEISRRLFSRAWGGVGTTNATEQAMGGVAEYLRLFARFMVRA